MAPRRIPRQRGPIPKPPPPARPADKLTLQQRQQLQLKQLREREQLVAEAKAQGRDGPLLAAIAAVVARDADTLRKLEQLQITASKQSPKVTSQRAPAATATAPATTATATSAARALVANAGPVQGISAGIPNGVHGSGNTDADFSSDDDDYLDDDDDDEDDFGTPRGGATPYMSSTSLSAVQPTAQYQHSSAVAAAAADQDDYEDDEYDEGMIQDQLLRHYGSGSRAQDREYNPFADDNLPSQPTLRHASTVTGTTSGTTSSTPTPTPTIPSPAATVKPVRSQALASRPSIMSRLSARSIKAKEHDPAQAAERAQEFLKILNAPIPTLHSSGMCSVDNLNSSNPTQLYYELHGTGSKKVFMISSMLTPTVLWHCQAHYFGSLDEYQVCIYDNRGGGRSSVNLRPYTAGLLARDASRLLDHLGWTREVHLVGLSLGGMVAQKLMLRAPERFESVAFISTYHSSLFAMPTLQDLGFFVKMFLFGDRSILPSFLRITFAKKWLAAEFEKDAGVTNYQLLNQALKRAMADRPNRSFPTKRLGSFAQLSAAVLHNLSASDLKKVRERNPALRLLVFGGTNDKVVRYGCAVALARILKCPLVTFHGTGHLLNIDQRDKLNVMLHAHFENIAPEDALYVPVHGVPAFTTPTNATDSVAVNKNPELISKEQADRIAREAIEVDDAITDSFDDDIGTPRLQRAQTLQSASKPAHTTTTTDAGSRSTKHAASRTRQRTASTSTTASTKSHREMAQQTMELFQQQQELMQQQFAQLRAQMELLGQRHKDLLEQQAQAEQAEQEEQEQREIRRERRRSRRQARELNAHDVEDLVSEELLPQPTPEPVTRTSMMVPQHKATAGHISMDMSAPNIPPFSVNTTTLSPTDVPAVFSPVRSNIPVAHRPSTSHSTSWGDPSKKLARAN